VDTISSLGSVDYRHGECGVDVTIWCSQKGMMLPPGLGLNAVSAKALEASRQARLPRSYWDWQPVLAAAQTGLFPYTPPTTLCFALREALAMLDEEGCPPSSPGTPGTPKPPAGRCAAGASTSSAGTPMTIRRR